MRHFLPYFLLMACLFGTLHAKAKDREHFIDPSLQRGVALLAPQPVNGVGVKIDTLRFCENHKHPLWRLCSWDYGTKFSKSNPSNTEYGIGYVDDAYLIARDDEGVITMKVDASKVYKSHRSASSQPWINFLLETEYDSLILAKASKATLTYKMRVLSCRNRMGGAYNTSIHAAQFLAYLYVRNINKESTDYMKSLWLGVGMYDNRCSKGSLDASITSWDIGTSTYIYNPAGESVFGTYRNLTDRKWHKVTVDIRKTIGDAIRSLNSNGYLKGSKVDDYAVCYMNIGWELPGTFDVVGQFRDISITSDAPLNQSEDLGETTIEIENEYTPYVCQKALDFSNVWDIEANIVDRNPTNGEIRLTEVERIPAGTPIILKAEAGIYQVPFLDAKHCSEEDLSANMLHVADSEVPLSGKAPGETPLLTDASQLSTNSIDTTVDGDGVGVNERGQNAADLAYLIDGKVDHVIMFRPDDYGGQAGAKAPWYVQCRLPEPQQDLRLVFDQLGGYGTFIDKLYVYASTDGKTFIKKQTFQGSDLHPIRCDISKEIHLDKPYSYLRLAGDGSGWGIDGWGLRELQLYGYVTTASYLFGESEEGWQFTRLAEAKPVDVSTIYLSLPEEKPLAGQYPLARYDFFPAGAVPVYPAPQADGACYDLLGRRIAAPQRGQLYIRNGHIYR